MKESTFLLKRTSLLFSMVVWVSFLFMYSTSLAQGAQPTKLFHEASPSSSNTLSNNQHSNYTTFDEEECGHETPSNNVENGLGPVHSFQFANDFTVNPNESFDLETLTVSFLVEYGETINSANIYFYEDSGDGPGEEITSLTSVTPTNDESIGDAFDFDNRKVSFDFEESISFPGSSAQTTYWVAIIIDYTGENSYFEVTSLVNTPNMLYYLDESNNWISSLEDPEFEGEYDGVILLEGECNELDGCTGQPEAGEIVADDQLEFCGNTSFNLMVTGATQTAGLIYQWQQKLPEDEDWVDIEDADGLTLQVSDGIMEDTDYRFRVECETNQEFAFTDVVTVTVKPASECYCTPVYSTGCSSGDLISNVTLVGESQTLDNDSECSTGAYGDYTDLSPADLAPGETYTLSVSTSYIFPTSEQVRAWIDFNQDGQFSDSEEIANTQGDGLIDGTGEFEFMVPENVDPGDYTMRVRLGYASSAPTFDACGSVVYGEAEDYMVEIIQLDQCQEPVSAGEPVETEIDVCANGAFSIGITGATDPSDGLSRQWQSSPAGEEEWTDVENAHSNNYTVSEGVDEPTDFRYKIVCNDGDPAYSDIIEVNLNPANECYCTPTYTYGCSSNDRISNVSLTGETNVIDNDSECSDNDYGDYTDLTPADLAPGETYTLSVSSDYTSPQFEDVRAWIDYNNNGSFDDDEEIANTQGNGLPNAGTGEFEFTVPEDVEPGNYRLRVRLVYSSSNIESCGNANHGETEDYMVEVIELDECQDPVSAGEIDDANLEVCSGINFTLAVTGASDPANNLTRQWQSSPAGEDDWSDIEGANSNTYVVPGGVDEPTDFRYKVVCGDGDAAYSDIIEVTLNPTQECYCVPQATNSNYYINKFSTTGAIDDITNMDSGFSDGGYGDFTDMVLSQENTQEVSFEVEIAGSTAGFRIWVDWNQDGQFDDNEVVYQSTGYNTSHSGSFIVPEDVEPGQTRMRIASHWLSDSGDVDPCATGFSGGEFEDYTFEVIELEDCDGMPTAGTPDEDAIEVCAGLPFTVSVSDASGASNNLYRRWQSSPAGEDDWTDIEGTSPSSYLVQDGVDEATDFRYVLTCNDEDTAMSDIIEVTLKPGSECYCTPTYNSGCSSGDRISNVSLTGESNVIDNDSECSDGYYGDYTDLNPADLAPGETYTLSVSSDYTSPQFEDVRAWIDYNQNGNFEDDEEIANTEGNGLPTTGTGEFEFTVPENASPGSYRMRVRMVYSNSNIQPCNDAYFGETEDYSVEVIELEDCEGPVIAGTVEEDFDICAGSSFTISVSGASDPANGLLRQWQSSPAGENDWTDMEGAYSNTYTVSDGIDEPTDFRYVVTCDDDATDTSDILSVTLKSADECYCIPQSNSNEYIQNVSTNGALQDIDNTTEFSENGYGDYTDTHVILVYPGQSFDYSISGNSPTMIYEGWLDIDQNGNFDGPLEHIISSDGFTGAPFTGTFEVPADFDEGTYRLRIRASWITSNLGPCENDPYGETEDYTVQVIIPDCFPPVNVEVDYITDVSAQVNWEANDEDSWIVVYGEEGFDPETEEDNVIEVEGTPSTDLTDLNDDTTYEVYIKTVCEADESVWIGPVKFTTNITPPENTRLCDAIALEPNSGCIDGPYTNVAAFEEVGEPIGSCHNNFRGTNTVWFTFVAAADGEATISTDFDSTEIQTEIVVFEAPTDCEDLSTLGEEVGCASASDEGVVELDGLNPGETYYVKVAGFNNAEGLFCIEVQMDETPVCSAPTEISIGEISDETVEVSWTAGGSETQWEVIYGEVEFNPETQGDSEIVNTTQITLTDLSPETDYEVYVRAICSDLNSDLAGPEVFTTEPMSVDSQIFADFTFYPNPVQGQLTLKAGSQIESVEVYNLLGQSVISAQPNTLEAQISTEALQSGVYLMEVSINGSQKSFRVVKK